MPALIQFVTGDTITVDEDFDKVNSRLHGNVLGGRFKRVDKGKDVQVTVYPANITYIEEYREPAGPGVAYG